MGCTSSHSKTNAVENNDTKIINNKNNNNNNNAVVNSKSTLPCVIKIISVNDVYELTNWPYFSTLKRAEKQLELEGTVVIAVCPGDFVAPSMLSSIDKGYYYFINNSIVIILLLFYRLWYD